MSKIAMSKDTTETQEETKEVKTETATETKAVSKKKMTKEEYKEKFRKMDLQYTGRLHIDEKYKNPDKILRIDNDDAATHKYLTELGYTLVKRDVEIGSGSLSQGSDMGSAVHIELGITFSQPGVLYEIDKDIYEARKEVEVEQNNQFLEDKIEASQREDQLGKRK